MIAKMDVDEKCVPIELFLEVLEKYKESERSVIWEHSGRISDDLKELDEEISNYKKLAEVRQIIRCKDCKHGEPGACGYGVDCDGVWHNDEWFCADAQRRDDDG